MEIVDMLQEGAGIDTSGSTCTSRGAGIGANTSGSTGTGAGA